MEHSTVSVQLPLLMKRVMQSLTRYCQFISLHRIRKIGKGLAKCFGKLGTFLIVILIVNIEIVAPARSGSNYFNYKNIFVVLLVLVDADCKLLAVDVRSYGKNSDGSIFANWRSGRRLENDYLLDKRADRDATTPVLRCLF